MLGTVEPHLSGLTGIGDDPDNRKFGEYGTINKTIYKCNLTTLEISK